MKLLMISTDRQLFVADSAVAQRQLKLLDQYDEIHIVVFSGRSFAASKIGSKVFVYPTYSRSRLSYIINAIKTGYRIIKKEAISKITCQDPFETGVVGYILKLIFKLPLELQIHTDLGSPYFYRQNLLNKIRFWTARFILPSADQVRVVSIRIKDFIKTFVKEDRIYIRPIAVDKEKIINSPIAFDLHQKYPQFKKVVLMVDRLELEKNVSLGIEVVVKINNPDIGLVVVGDGSQKASLEKLARDLDAPVVFEGQVSDLASYYKTADLFLHTSLFEGYGLVLVEAQVAGLSIVSTDVGVAADVGAKIVPYDADVIADKIKNILV